MAPGALDALTKEMLYVAVSVSNQCGYCIASHTAAARKAGMTDATALLASPHGQAVLPGRARRPMARRRRRVGLDHGVAAAWSHDPELVFGRRAAAGRGREGHRRARRRRRGRGLQPDPGQGAGEGDHAILLIGSVTAPL